MTDAEAVRWLRYALAWTPKDVWEDLRRDGDWPNVEAALAHADTEHSDGCQGDAK